MVKQMANVIVVMGILIAVALVPGSSAAQRYAVVRHE